MTSIVGTELSPVEAQARDDFNRTWTEPPGLMGALRTINNIPIAHRYMAAGFLFFLVGGVQALLLRIQLGTPENTFLDAETYNQIFTMHGTTMMFLFVIPFIEAIAGYMVPLVIGARDLPFPRLTAFSFWTYVFGGVFLYSSFAFGMAPNAGWFAYVPLSGKEFSPGLNLDFWDIGLSVAEIAALGAASELIIGILRMRAPGMSLMRLPLFAWAMLITAFMIIFAFTPLIVGTALLELDRKELTVFFEADSGGSPVLWQHLFWVFGHPEVYIMFLPAAGIVSHIVQTFSRRPMVGYRLMVGSMIATGLISFTLWIHHMFAGGMSMRVMAVFTAASMTIAIPSGIQVFCWVATLWTGRPLWRTPLLFVIGFLFIFVLGGITGVMVAAVPFDSQVHDSYFVVAHFHYVLIGGAVFPLIAGLYYWLPKITGRMLSERLGRWNFWVMFIFFNVAFFPMHISGLLGMPRRIYTYEAGLGWDGYNLISTVGAFGFAAGVALFVANFFWSLTRGDKAGDNPWTSDTLEWSQSSPPAEAQFPTVPVVRGLHPLWEQHSLEPADEETERSLRALHWGPRAWRGGLVVSMRDARPVAIAHLPGPTIWPLVAAVGVVIIFAAALIDNPLLFGVGALVTVAGVVGWLWPQESEALAIREMGSARQSQALPLATFGPISNGWWAILVTVLVLLVALGTLVASYFYLAARWDQPPSPDLQASILGCVATLLLASCCFLQRWVVRAWGASQVTRRRLGLAITFLLGIFVLITLLLLYGYHQTRFTAHIHAYDSMILIMILFQGVVTLLTLTLQAVAQAWAWLAPDDPRGIGAAANAAPISYFGFCSWVVITLTMYVSPWLS